MCLWHLALEVAPEHNLCTSTALESRNSVPDVNIIIIYNNYYCPRTGKVLLNELRYKKYNIYTECNYIQYYKIYVGSTIITLILRSTRKVNLHFKNVRVISTLPGVPK